MEGIERIIQKNQREYTKEDLERAWDNRLGNYGVSLTVFSTPEEPKEWINSLLKN